MNVRSILVLAFAYLLISASAAEAEITPVKAKVTMSVYQKPNAYGPPRWTVKSVVEYEVGLSADDPNSVVTLPYESSLRYGNDLGTTGGAEAIIKRGTTQKWTTTQEADWVANTTFTGKSEIKAQYSGANLGGEIKQLVTGATPTATP